MSSVALSSYSFANSLSAKSYRKIIGSNDRINIAVSLTPVSSVGIDGDIAGDIAVDSNYFYYCTAAWDGSTNIWKRVALDVGTW